jgi:hypothetical protein
MAFASHRVRIALSAAVAALLTVAMLLAGADGAPAASKLARATHAGHHRAVGLRAGIGWGHALKRPAPCLRRALARRGRWHLNTKQRRRLTRRARRSCVATSSTAPPVPLYWGAWIGSQLTGTEAPWDMNAASSFERSVGKSLSLLHFAAPFADCSHSPCSFYDFPSEPMEDVRRHGAIPFFDWSSQSTPSSLNEPDFQLSDVIGGSFDSYIRGFAEEARDWGHPFFLRFDWEMNGNWFPWSEGVNGNNAGEYVAAWRHVHDIFTEAGATNATWVWCPNVDPGNQLQNLSSLYPGDAYVDWTGLDGYNWGTMPSRPSGWISFERLFHSSYEEITAVIAPSKPLVIGEVGSTEYGGSKAEWISEMLSGLPTDYPKVRGMLWFDKYDDGDWALDTSSSATSAFATGIQDASYRDNSYANLGTGPVQPPA